MRAIVLLFSFALVIMTHSVSAQVKYSNDFLNINIGARAHGLGGAMTALSGDITSTYWNPAGLTKIDAPAQIGLMHAEWFAGISQLDYLAFGKQLNEAKHSYLGLSVIRFGTDNIANTINLYNPDGSANYDNITSFSAADYAIVGSYGTRLKNPKLSVGGSVKVIRRVLGKFGGAWGFGADLGMQYTTERLRLGVQARDITGTFNAWSITMTDAEKAVFVSTGNELPKSNNEITTPTILIGGAYLFNLSSKLSLLPTTDLAITTDGKRNTLINSSAISIDPRIGVEFDYDKFVQLRLGVNNVQRVTQDFDPSKKSINVQPNLGIGLKMSRIQVDYALSNIGNGGVAQYSHIVSVWFNLKPKTKKTGI
jgi:hypothetical protein